MRTTVTLEADVLRSLKDEAHRSNRPLKAVLNEAIQRGLAPARRGQKRRYRLTSHAATLAPGIDPQRLNQLVDELSDGASGP